MKHNQLFVELLESFVMTQDRRSEDEVAYMLCQESWGSDKLSGVLFGRTEAYRSVNAIHVNVGISL